MVCRGQQLLPRSSQEVAYSGFEIGFKSAVKLPARKQVVSLRFCLVWWGGTEERGRVSGAANPSHVLPGQAPKTSPEEMPHLPHHSQKEKAENPQDNPNPWASRCQRIRFYHPAPLSVALEHTQDPSAWPIVLCPGRHPALCLGVFFCKSKPWFVWGCSHCFTLWEGFCCVFWTRCLCPVHGMSRKVLKFKGA